MLKTIVYDPYQRPNQTIMCKICIQSEQEGAYTKFVHKIRTQNPYAKSVHKIRTQCDDKLFLLCRKIRSVDRHERNKNMNKKLRSKAKSSSYLKYASIGSKTNIHLF